MNETLLDSQEKTQPSLAEMLGMAQSDEMDIESLKKRAENADEETACNLALVIGHKYEKGDGVPQDTLEAMYWYEQSGNAAALVALGQFFAEQGNLDQAEACYLKAVDAKHDTGGSCAYACVKLGTMYLLEKKKEDFVKADIYLGKAIRTETDQDLVHSIKKFGALLGLKLYTEEPEKGIYWMKQFLETEEDEQVRSIVDAYEKKGKAGTDAGQSKAEPVEEIPVKWLGCEDANAILDEMKQKGETVLRIPEGYTGIEGFAFHGGTAYNSHKMVRKITEVYFPESMRDIRNAFFAAGKLTKIHLPKNLEYLGYWAFDRTNIGFLGIETHPQMPIERLEIPAQTELAAAVAPLGGNSAFRGAYEIQEIIFLDGRKEINWLIFEENQIGYIYIPDSVETMTHGEDLASAKVKITKLSMPKHLQGQFESMNMKRSVTAVEWR
jgi:TPR repeat protein